MPEQQVVGERGEGYSDLWLWMEVRGGSSIVIWDTVIFPIYHSSCSPSIFIPFLSAMVDDFIPCYCFYLLSTWLILSVVRRHSLTHRVGKARKTRCVGISRTNYVLNTNLQSILSPYIDGN